MSILPGDATIVACKTPQLFHYFFEKFVVDIIVGRIKLYDKNKKVVHNSNFKTKINKNDNENKTSTEPHYNQSGLTILVNMI